MRFMSCWKRAGLLVNNESKKCINYKKELILLIFILFLIFGWNLMSLNSDYSSSKRTVEKQKSPHDVCPIFEVFWGLTVEKLRNRAVKIFYFYYALWQKKISQLQYYCDIFWNYFEKYINMTVKFIFHFYIYIFDKWITFKIQSVGRRRKWACNQC